MRPGFGEGPKIFRFFPGLIVVGSDALPSGGSVARLRVRAEVNFTSPPEATTQKTNQTIRKRPSIVVSAVSMSEVSVGELRQHYVRDHT